MINNETASNKAEGPEWAFETPDELERYELVMIDVTRGAAAQDIEITRDEFIVLKRKLATLRGIELNPDDDDRSGLRDATDQLIRTIAIQESPTSEAARAILRHKTLNGPQPSDEQMRLVADALTTISTEDGVPAKDGILGFNL